VCIAHNDSRAERNNNSGSPLPGSSVGVPCKRTGAASPPDTLPRHCMLHTTSTRNIFQATTVRSAPCSLPPALVLCLPCRVLPPMSSDERPHDVRKEELHLGCTSHFDQPQPPQSPLSHTRGRVTRGPLARRQGRGWEGRGWVERGWRVEAGGRRMGRRGQARRRGLHRKGLGQGQSMLQRHPTAPLRQKPRGLRQMFQLRSSKKEKGCLRERGKQGFHSTSTCHIEGRPCPCCHSFSGCTHRSSSTHRSGGSAEWGRRRCTGKGARDVPGGVPVVAGVQGRVQEEQPGCLTRFMRTRDKRYRAPHHTPHEFLQLVHCNLVNTVTLGSTLHAHVEWGNPTPCYICVSMHKMFPALTPCSSPPLSPVHSIPSEAHASPTLAVQCLPRRKQSSPGPVGLQVPAVRGV